MKQYKLSCHIMHYQPSQLIYIICNEDMIDEVKRQLKETNILIDFIEEI